MDIGIGLPNTVPGSTGASLLDWGRRAEAAGFSGLASIGAVSYPGFEELTLFAAAGAVTERITFLTNVLIAPARSTAELAKQAATVDQLTNGRLTLGLSVGWRRSDFTLTGRDYHTRGADFDRQLADLRAAWAGEVIAPETRPVAPAPVRSTIPIMIGGTSDAAIRRVIEHGVGWASGGGPPDAAAAFAERVRTAWREAGKDGTPRISALAYFSLGDTEEESRRNLLHYYEPMGAQISGMIAGNVLRSPDAIRAAIAAFAAAGVDELYLDPSVSDPGQVDLLAEAALG